MATYTIVFEMDEEEEAAVRTLQGELLESRAMSDVLAAYVRSWTQSQVATARIRHTPDVQQAFQTAPKEVQDQIARLLRMG